MSENAENEISGYDLADYLLSKGGVNALLKYARNEEVDWQELKIAMELLPEDRAKGLTEKDLYSKYAQEVIALANTAGGAMILGIKDKSLALEPLANHDPLHKIENGGMDDYIRDFVRPKIWPNDLKWTNRGKVWELMDKTAAEKLLTWLHRPYRDPEGKEGEVVVVLVRPCEDGQLAN